MFLSPKSGRTPFLRRNQGCGQPSVRAGNDKCLNRFEVAEYCTLIMAPFGLDPISVFFFASLTKVVLVNYLEKVSRLSNFSLF